MIEDRTQEKEIDGVQYRCSPLMLSKGIPALVRLIKVAAPLLGAASTGDNARVLEMLPANLTADEVFYFAEIFGECSSYLDGDHWQPLIRKPKNFQDLHFQGDYLRFLRWLTFCVEVNFGGFFSGAMAGLPVGAPAQPKVSPSRSMVGIGSSGG